MSYIMTPIAPVRELSINSNPVGAIRSFSERAVSVPIPVYGIGQKLPVSFVPSTAYFEISISRLLTDKNVFAQTISPHQLHNFTLQISGGGRVIQFSGCEYQSIAVRDEAGVGTVEESVILAISRTEN